MPWTSSRARVTITLDRLAGPDVAALVAAAGGGAAGWDAGDLAAESEGLPLYVVEALAAGPGAASEAPRGVRALLRERLSSVGETATQVLATAAVIGRTFDLGTVRVASGRSEDEAIDALEELVRRAIVREVDRGGEPVFDFGHARLRDAAYEDIGLARRRLLHRRVAEVLRSGGRQDSARLAQIAGPRARRRPGRRGGRRLPRGGPAGAGGVRQPRGAGAPVGRARPRAPGRGRARARDRRGAHGARRLRGRDRGAGGGGRRVGRGRAAIDRAAARPGPRPAWRRPDRRVPPRRGARGDDGARRPGGDPRGAWRRRAARR